ncbi:transporter [Sphingomicrobium astaxanthinifaciens]|uniref:transporter n=1 Tax=Sphingomicrobium astaxanthinifaciens TaxID=1227949 RepID=UPI001FCC86B4|nr:transporter [Sphingomicrobium astaxanthinifaciens]MCJ7422375.1 transporter [Sphingomicrobium astaxanthinifaciens]
MLRSLMLAGLASLALATPAQAQRVTVSTGADYSSGSYGTDTKTSVLVVPFGVRVAKDRWSLGASLPFLSIDGSNSVVGGGGAPIVEGEDTTSSRRSGVGDLSLRAGYDLIDVDGVELSMGGRVKLPTGDAARNLSTGKADLSLGGELAYTSGNVTPFVELGHRWLGDPADRDLDNGLYGTLGATLILSADLIGIVSYDFSQASVNTVADSHSLFGGLVTRLDRRFSLTGYGTVGLSSGAPDYGVGLLLSLRAAD